MGMSVTNKPVVPFSDCPFRITRTELVWPGKYDERGEIPEPRQLRLPFSTLERIEGQGGPTEDCWRNRLIHGDNLLALSSLQDLEGKIDLIYVDPPFATGNDFSFTARQRKASMEIPAYRDVWNEDKSSFLEMLWPRAQLMRRLLSERGLLFAHFDDNIGHEVKLLLDEVFGASHKRGEIIWQLGTGAKSRRFFSVQHNLILVYSKGKDWIFRKDSPLLREPFAQGSLKTHFRKVDEKGRRYRKRVIGGKEYVYYADEGRMVGSIWTDIPSMTANSPIIKESTGYPTQKPEKLLERVLAACTEEDSIVADFFCGSGTTLAVAEKMGLRWVGCDVGRLAVQTSRKRLLDLRTQDCRAFDVLGMGAGERLHGLEKRWGKGRKGEQALRAFLLDRHGAVSTKGLLHGKKGNDFVYLGPIGRSVTRQEMGKAAAQARRSGGSGLHILAWEFESGPYEAFVQQVKQEHGVDLKLFPIPREVLSGGETGIWEMGQACIEVESKDSLEVKLVFSDFIFPSKDLLPARILGQVDTSLDLVDGWAVDWDYRGVFVNRWWSHRNRQGRGLVLETPSHRFDGPGERQLAVKVVDILGQATMWRSLLS